MVHDPGKEIIVNGPTKMAPKNAKLYIFQIGRIAPTLCTKKEDSERYAKQ